MPELEGVQSYIVSGYVFETKKEYADALQEKKGISYLGSQLNLNNTEKVHALYTELIEKKIFYTPIGYDYLKQLRDVLIKSGKYNSEEILPIPVPTSSEQEKNRLEKYISTKYEASVKKYETENKKLKSRLSTSNIICFVLVIMVIAMIIISKNSSTPNILNYERKLQDKYASWEQELQTKEQQLKDIEWKLKNGETVDWNEISQN